MGDGFLRESKGVVDETIRDLDRLEGRMAAARPVPPGTPQYFLLISRASKLMLHHQLSELPAVELDAILAAVCDFIEEQPALEDGNIYLSKLKGDSILMETLGTVILAMAFHKDVERDHYREFHRAVKHIQKTFPSIASWDGKPGQVAESLQRAFGHYFHGAAPKGPAAPGRPPPAAGGGGPAPGEPDLQDCERRMRIWYEKGYRIDRLKEAIHGDLSRLERTFDEYEVDVACLEMLKERVRQLEEAGFGDEARKVKPMLNDPARADEAERTVEALATRAKEIMTIPLPVDDPAILEQAIKALPLGIPSALWGLPLDSLVEAILQGERGCAPDGKVVVQIRGVWFPADPGAKDFLTPFTGPVRNRRLLPPPAEAQDELDDILTKLIDEK